MIKVYEKKRCGECKIVLIREVEEGGIGIKIRIYASFDQLLQI